MKKGSFKKYKRTDVLCVQLRPALSSCSELQTESVDAAEKPAAPSQCQGSKNSLVHSGVRRCAALSAPEHFDQQQHNHVPQRPSSYTKPATTICRFRKLTSGLPPHHCHPLPCPSGLLRRSLWADCCGRKFQSLSNHKTTNKGKNIYMYFENILS